MKETTKQVSKKTLFGRFLNGVEDVGNRLPYPITMFALLTLGIALIPRPCVTLGVLATGEMIDGRTTESTEQTISVVSLTNREGLVYILTNVVTDFTSFTPLGVVLVTILDVGCAEDSGYLPALVKKTVSVTPAMIVTPMLVFLGVMSNVASDVRHVVLIPIGIMVFVAYGRCPVAGLATVFAGVSGGFSTNLPVGTLDPMLSGISTEAAGTISPDYVVTAMANWYFMLVSTFVIVAVETFVMDKIVEPRLSAHRHSDEDVASATALRDNEKKALKMANLGPLTLVALIAVLAFPQGSFLRNLVAGNLMTPSPFMDGLIVVITLLFSVPSIVYGRVAETYKNEKNTCAQLGDNMSAIGGYITLSFAAVQFINYFNYTKMGTVLALKGAEALGTAEVGGPVLMILFVLFVAVINLLIGSASTKWTILVPVFIPMFMLLDYSPGLTQVAYRIGDPCTSLITSLMSYLAMVVIFAKKYDKESGIGALISAVLPYSLFFMINWAVLLVIWMVFGPPFGPEAGLLV